jgi:hypothetical protein
MIPKVTSCSEASPYFQGTPISEESLFPRNPQPYTKAVIPRARSSCNSNRWLSTEGPYRDCIAAWCELNPNLRIPDSGNQWSPLQDGNARVAMIELKQGNQVNRRDFTSATELSAHLRDSSSGNSSIGRMYIMEGLAPDFNAALGNHFLMDPTFFMGQERTTIFGLSHQGSQQIPSLPSLRGSETMFLIRYYELRDFGIMKTFNMWCARTSRTISTTGSTRPDLHDHEFEPIGIVQRKCSFWSQRYDNSGWVG